MPKIKALGEIALRVNDLNAMVEFYEGTIGLQLMRQEKQFAFFKIAEGFEGHTQVLALFDRSQTANPYTPPSSPQTSIDHIAFTISRKDFEGDVTVVVFSLLRASKKSPEETGNDLGAWLQENEDLVAGFNVVKGFLNLVISDSFWLSVLQDAIANEQYGFAPASGNTVMLE